MPAHHDEKHHVEKHHVHDGRRDEKAPGRATVALAGNAVTYPTIDAAGDAVAQIYTRMFALVTAGPARAQ